MSQDQVDLDPQTVSNGLAKWDQAAATLQSRWTAINSQITGLLTDATFGGDEPGSKFEQSFVVEGQAGTLATRGSETVGYVAVKGQDIRRCVEDSLAADEQQASEVGVDVPSFNTGGGGGSGSGGSGGSGSGGGGGSAGGGSAMMMASGSPSGSSSGAMMAEMVPGSAQFSAEGEMVPEDQGISYERQPIAAGQDRIHESSPSFSAADEAQVFAGPGGGAQFIDRGEGITERVYDAPHAGNERPVDMGNAGQGRETDAISADRMTTMPVEESGSTQPSPVAGERGQEGGGPARQAPEGPAETIRERLAERIPDSVVAQLPDGLAERIYEARGDYGIEVAPVTPMQGIDNATEGVQLTGAQDQTYLTGDDELPVERPV